MGYHTEFDGEVTIDPPLNDAERTYINKFCETRRMSRTKGPYYVDNAGFAGQDREDDINNYNRPPQGQPGLWCKWEVSEDGSDIHWSGAEKFYDAAEWMQYLIDHFLKPGAEASQMTEDPQFANFTFDHVVNGEIDAEGEEQGDVWKLVVKDNVVSTKRARLVWEWFDFPEQF